MADPSKTEKATPRRRDELRRKGQVAKSQELNTALLFLVAVFFLRWYMPFMGNYVTETTQDLWRNLILDMSVHSFMVLMRQISVQFLLMMAPFLSVLLLIALVSNIFQVGFRASLESVKPDLNKVNPIQGFKRFFSLQPLVQLGINLFKIAVLVWISWNILNAHYAMLLQSSLMNLDNTGRLLGAVVWEIAWKVGLAMLVIAIGDFFWQRWYFERNIRMSKQEVKDESKNMEGDPQIKSRIRQLQRKAALNRMMENVPRADVILTNPTHLSIAIAYDKDTMNAPEVLAKGADKVALRIRERAEEFDIPRIENKPLAQALFRSAEVGEPIPADLYSAVSEVLIYVYQLTGRLDDFL